MPLPSAPKGVGENVKRPIVLGLLITLLLLGSPMAPATPAHADSDPVLLILPGGLCLLIEGDPDTPDGTESGNYVVQDDSGDVVEVDHNWLLQFLFDTFGTWFELTK